MIYLPIKNCQECPYFKKERYYTEDSFETAFDWFCNKENKKIAEYVDWKEEDTVPIPKWCPFIEEIKIDPARITPENITELTGGECFVFGSNLSGFHGKGAAKLAHKKFGATWGQAFGISGHSYAIPTKDKSVKKTLELEVISYFVDMFLMDAEKMPHILFLVTEIGCGLAGLDPKDVAPLFKKAMDMPNISLPQRFWDHLV